MTSTSDRSARSSGQATVGRLGGLTRSEAERGERALWLTGGGWRAGLFHLGALTRLNELGLLARLGTVGAVSGSSVLAALLATRVEWPLHGAYRDWPEHVAEPLRSIARRNARARALLRVPFPRGGEAALAERYARQLVASGGGEPRWGPRFVFGASGLTLSGLAAGWEESLEWEIGDAAAHGYSPQLVREAIAAVRTDLDAFGEGEQAVLENHGYLLADAALRAHGLVTLGGIDPGPPQPPHPQWMSERRVREALRASGRRTALGRLRPHRPGPPARRPQPREAELEALLRRHRPLLQYDSLEGCRADSVATICELAAPGRCNTLHRADGSVIAAAAPASGQARLSAGFLGADRYANGEPVRRGDYLDESGGSHAGDALAIRGRDGYADVAYGRARRDREGRLWLQYWLFFYFDDKGWLGLQQHEGDWEMVQLRLDERGRPDAVTLARHGGASRLAWAEAELAPTDGGPALAVYPARGSHAPLPGRGSYAAPLLPDHNDGLGPRLRPRLEAIGDDGPGWALWPGRWGSTRRREYFEADSPFGPARRPQWWDPLELHEEARPAADELLAGEPAAGAPPRPRLRARRDGDLALIDYAFPDPGPGEGEPARIVAAPFDRGEEPSAASCFTVDRLHSSFAVQLPPERRWDGVRVGITSASGACGPTVAVPLT